MKPATISAPRGRSVPEIAKSLSISEGKVWEQIRKGKLVATKIGSRTVVLAEHESAWIAGLKNSEKGGSNE